MKKINVTKIGILVVLLLALSVVGCGNDDNTDTSKSKTFGIFTFLPLE